MPGSSCANATYVTNFQISTTRGRVGRRGRQGLEWLLGPLERHGRRRGGAIITGIAGPNHYAVSAAGSAVNCAPTASPSPRTTARIRRSPPSTPSRLSTSTGHGDWTLATGGGTFTAGSSNSGRATYTYSSADAGVAVFNLRDTYPETVTIGVIGRHGDRDLRHRDSPPRTAPITFAPSGFITTNGANVATAIGTQIAGKTFDPKPGAAGRAHRHQHGRLHHVFASGTTANISLAYQCNNPTACIAGQTLAITNNAVTTTIASNPNSGVTRLHRGAAQVHAPRTPRRRSP